MQATASRLKAGLLRACVRQRSIVMRCLGGPWEAITPQAESLEVTKTGPNTRSFSRGARALLRTVGRIREPREHQQTNKWTPRRSRESGQQVTSGVERDRRLYV